MNKRVKQLVKILEDREEECHQFALKHGFAYKRPQDFKDCILIKWKWVKKGIIDYPKLEEYTALSHKISDRYNLWVKEDLLLESRLRLFKGGIYCFSDWLCHAWAIPNEFKEVQDYVLRNLPEWAEVRVKKVTT